MKPLKMKVRNSIIGLISLVPLQIQAAPDLIHGGVLTITSGEIFTSTTLSPFNVKDVVSNTLLRIQPINSKITIPASGNYIATTTVHTCRGGASGFLDAAVVFKGISVAVTTNNAFACGSSVATASIYARKGDEISGQCRIGQGMPSTCSFSLALVGLPYY